MRTTRKRKFRKTHVAIKLFWHLGLVWCLIMMVCINLPLNKTNALFTDQIQYDSTLKAGDWSNDSNVSVTDNGVEKEIIPISPENNPPTENASSTEIAEPTELKSDTGTNPIKQSDTAPSEESTVPNTVEEDAKTNQENSETLPNG